MRAVFPAIPAVVYRHRRLYHSIRRMRFPISVLCTWFNAKPAQFSRLLPPNCKTPYIPTTFLKRIRDHRILRSGSHVALKKLYTGWTKTRIPSGIWSRLYGYASRAESVSCNTAVKWHAHIFKWHSAGWPRAPTADCVWSAIGPPTQENFFVTDRNVTTWVASRSVREARLKTDGFWELTT